MGTRSIPRVGGYLGVSSAEVISAAVLHTAQEGHDSCLSEAGRSWKRSFCPGDHLHLVMFPLHASKNSVFISPICEK